MLPQTIRLHLIFITAICIVLFLSIFGYTKIILLSQSAQQVNHTTQVTLNLEKIISNLKDVETGFRGYLLTHDNSFLAPYHEGLKALPHSIKNVRMLTINSSSQIRSLRNVELIAQRRQQYMSHILEFDKQRKISNDQLLYGKSMMDSMRLEIKNMIEYENILIQKHNNQLSEQATLAPFVILLSSVVAMIILILVYIRLQNIINQTNKLKADAIYQAVEIAKSKQISDSEKRYYMMLKKSPFCFAVLKGDELMISFANDAIKEVWGKGHDVEGKMFFKILPELVETTFPDLMQEVMKTGVPFHGKDMLAKINKDGIIHDGYFNFVYQPYYEADETISGITIIAIEVTKEVNAKMLIEQSEVRFRNMVEQAPVAVNVLKGENYIIDLVNEKQLELWGKTKAELLNQPIFQAFPETVGQGFKALLNNIYTTGKSFQANELPLTIVRNGTKETIFVNSISDPLYNTAGEVDGIISVSINVTEQVLTRERIEESEKRFRNLAQTLPQLIWMTDAEGRLEFASDRWETYAGLMPRTVSEWASLIHQNDFKIFNDKWRENITSGQLFTFDIRLKSKAGEYRWHSLISEPVYDDEKIIKWVGGFTDIHSEKLFINELESKVKFRTAELEQNNIELEKKNRELESFTFITSHDLQEPLRKIQTYSSIIYENESHNLSVAGKDSVNRINSAASRMQLLIRDLLLYTRTTLDESNFSNTNLQLVLNEVKEDLREELLAKNAVVETTAMCNVKIVPYQFRQLMLNLIGNSLKFTKPQSSPFIKISSRKERGINLDNEKLAKDKLYCHIQIADNGIGFEQQYSEKIFQIFQRLHNKQDFEGTGIGLAIAKKIVENHDGIITASGEPNRGATFDIYFPS